MPTTDIDDSLFHQGPLDPAVGDMVESLARRQQALVNGLLVLVDELEQDETSPTRLDRLFRVDHLATLLGRTATNLGVLLDTTTRATTAAMPLADVLQAAVAAVDDFRRVSLPSAPAVEVVSEAATDVVHLLTEVIDHSLASSTAVTTVTVHTSDDVDDDADDDAEDDVGQVVLRIANTGLTLAAESLTAINTMLRPGSRPIADCPQATGLYVVSRLAHRHGLSVQLSPEEGAGTTATIRIPATLFLEGGTKPQATGYVGRHRR